MRIRPGAGLAAMLIVLAVAPGCSPAPNTGVAATKPGNARAVSADATPSIPAVLPPTSQEVSSAVVQLMAADPGVAPGTKIASVRDIKTAQDSKGRWWASALVVPKDFPEVDNAVVFIYEVDGRWHVFDLGTGIDNSELPADVRSKL